MAGSTLNTPIRTIPALDPNWPMALMSAPTLPAPAQPVTPLGDPELARTMAFMGANPPSLPARPAPAAPAPTGRFPVAVATTAMMAAPRAAPATTPAPKKQSASISAPIRRGRDLTAADYLPAVPISFPMGGVGSAMIISPSVGASVARTKAPAPKSSVPDKVAPSKLNPNNQTNPVTPVQQVIGMVAPAKQPTQEEFLRAAQHAILTKQGGFTQDEFQLAMAATPQIAAGVKSSIQPKQAAINAAMALGQEKLGQTVAQADAAVKSGAMSPEDAQAAIGRQRDDLMDFLLSLSGAKASDYAMAGMYGTPTE